MSSSVTVDALGIKLVADSSGLLDFIATGLRANLGALIRSVNQGLACSYVGTTSFAVASGVIADSTFSETMALAASMTKTTSAWATGSGNGGKMSAAAIATTTWYYVYLIKNPTTGVVDCGFDVSATAPTLPTGYTLYRLIAAVKTDGSSHWVQWISYPDGTQEWLTQSSDQTDSTLTTARKSYTLGTIPPINVKATLYGAVSNASASVLVGIFGDTNITDAAPAAGSVAAGTQVANVLNYFTMKIDILAGIVYARSTAASTTIQLAARDFNVRPYN